MGKEKDKLNKKEVKPKHKHKHHKHKHKHKQHKKEDKVSEINQKLAETKAALISDIDKTLKRGDDLAALDQAADELVIDVKSFTRKARTTKYVAWPKRIMTAMTISGAIIGFILGIYWSCIIYTKVFSFLAPFLIPPIIGGSLILGTAIFGLIGWAAIQAAALYSSTTSKVQDKLEQEIPLPPFISTAISWLPYSGIKPKKVLGLENTSFSTNPQHRDRLK